MAALHQQLLLQFRLSGWGDLMAAAGVKYTVGRESNSVYGENWNGVQKGIFHHGHYFKDNIDPYKLPGDPSSGLLPRISTEIPINKDGACIHDTWSECRYNCFNGH